MTHKKINISSLFPLFPVFCLYMLTKLQGQIKKIIYTNEDSGFSIARLQVEGQRELVTITGNLLSPTPGEILELQGEWTIHPKYGEQFKIVSYKTIVPATKKGIEKYLGSGLVKGIGRRMAKRIVKEFGENTLDIIENDINKLLTLEGFGRKRVAMIKKAWDEQKEIRDVMVFLQEYGVSPGFAAKIFKHYGKKSITVVKKNPYMLAMDVFGIGFRTADKIAQKLGIDPSSDTRVQAGIIYVLTELTGEGHIYYPYTLLIEKSMDILQVKRDTITKAFATISMEKKIIIEDVNEDIDEFKENNKAVYLPMYHFCEVMTAKKLLTLGRGKASMYINNPEGIIEWVQNQLSMQLAAMQKKAIKEALEHKVLIITGGPGTGKTTIINGILKIYSRNSTAILCAAPTGRAAKRMTETTGYEAKTIHRLLEYNFKAGGFTRNDENPLDCDLLIVDEASMIDSILIYHLLKALPDTARIIFVGDVHQLPSVGPGTVLQDIIESGVFPVITLYEIFRQAQHSRIIMNAHQINAGIIPQFSADQGDTDFYFIEQEKPEKICDIITALVQQRIPVKFGFDPVDDIQVLTPMHKGIVGTDHLNSELQRILNPTGEEITRAGRTYRLHDKVMQVRNNYDKEVFNGDIGRITAIDKENQEVTICFDSHEVIYDFNDLDEIIHSYAISVHKSQGSEYPAVVIPVVTQHYMLLQRNLIYTAVTRGKKLVVMVGTKKALAIGIKNVKTRKRYTYLKYRLLQSSI